MVETFRQRVRAILDKKNWTQASLAAEAGIPAPTVSKILTGGVPPSNEQVLAIARALETTALELSFGTDAQAIVADWVPRALLEAEAEERLRAQQRLAKLQTRLDEAHAAIRSHEAAAERLHRELAEKGSALQESEATRAAAERRNEALERSRADALDQARIKDLERLRANEHVQRLAAQLVATKGEMVEKAVVTGVLSFLGGVLATGSSGRARSAGRRTRSRAGRARS